MPPIHFSLLSSYRSTHVARGKSLSWEDLCLLLTTHTPAEDKFSVQVFTACIFKDFNGPRNDANADVASLFIYDIDAFSGNPKGQFETLLGRLKDLDYVIYSSHSHNPSEGRYSYRLVVPLSTPLARTAWKQAHQLFLKRFDLPADEEKCKGISHPYFLPSCPPSRLSAAEVYASNRGKPLDVEAFVNLYTVEQRQPNLEARIPEGSVDAMGEPINLDDLRALLKNKAHSLYMKGHIERSKLLKKVINQEPLIAGDGKHAAMLKVTGDMVWALPTTTPMEAYVELITPTMEQTVLALDAREISKLHHMFIGAFQRKMAYVEKQVEEQDQAMKALQNSIDYVTRMRGGLNGT